MRFDNIKKLENFLIANGFKGISIKNDNWVMCCCPFHNDKNPSFGINVLTLKGHCFCCGWFEWEEILKQMGLPVDEELDTIDAMTGVNWRAIKDKLDFGKVGIKEKIKRFNLPNDCELIADSNKTVKACEYLYNRGYDVSIIREFNLKFCLDEKSKYYKRIILPINDFQGRLVFFDARSIDNIKKQKYIRPFGSPIKYCLGGIDKVYESHSNYAVLVEGYLDMVKLWQFNIPAVCTFGSDIHQPQIKMLMQKHLDCIVLGYDNDQAGIKANNKVEKMLYGCGSKVCKMNMLIGNDPGDFKTREEVFSVNKFLLKIS